MPKNIKGNILAAVNNSSAIGKWDIVVIDKGKADGTQIGSMFSILRSGQSLLVDDDEIIYQEDSNAFDQIGDEDLKLPPERVGELMVFKVYENLSIAILMRGNDVIGSTYKIEGLTF
jgi:hypothetical protein